MMDAVSWISDEGKSYRAYDEVLADQGGMLRLIDQRLLPGKFVYVQSSDPRQIFDYIKTLTVRGAPAIGCAAALGLAAVMRSSVNGSYDKFITEAKEHADYLASSRPTAVNLRWALDRCLGVLEKNANCNDLKNILLREALDILNEDINLCRSIGENALTLFKDGMSVLTHCNAGALATGDYGTALSAFYLARERGINLRVYSDETRPLLQGSRLTAWELQRSGVDVTTICDNMAGFLMQQGKIDAVIVGADRIAANGDAANKIGTYSVAVLAKYHRIPFYVAAPYSTFDFSLTDGSLIPIEERDGSEVRHFGDRLTTPENVKICNPAFDVTPHELITAIVTEKLVITEPNHEKIAEHML